MPPQDGEVSPSRQNEPISSVQPLPAQPPSDPMLGEYVNGIETPFAVSVMTDGVPIPSHTHVSTVPPLPDDDTDDPHDDESDTDGSQQTREQP